MKKRCLLLVLGFGLTLFSCGRIDTLENSPEYPIDAFFPFGKYEWTYEVDSVIYDLVGGEQKVDSSRSYLRFRMDSVNQNWFLVVDERADRSSEWHRSGDIQLQIQNGALLWNQDGRTLIVFEEPIRGGANWNESKLVDPETSLVVSGEFVAPFSLPWEAEIVEIDDDSDLLTKVSIDEDVLIERRLKREVYESGVGLIRASGFIADTQCEHISGELGDCIDIPWPEKANKGFQYHLKLESFSSW